MLADVPQSSNIRLDMQHAHLDRGIADYEPPLEWANLILQGQSPIASTGSQHAPSLLFPMDEGWTPGRGLDTHEKRRDFDAPAPFMGVPISFVRLRHFMDVPVSTISNSHRKI